jgi:hypothetical protein
MENLPGHVLLEQVDLIPASSVPVVTQGIRCPMLVNYEEAGGGGGGGTKVYGSIS